MADDEQEEKTISQDLVVTKYKMAAEIVNSALKLVMGKCVEGASVLEVCEFGDKFLMEETAKVYKKEKDMKKGIAFPTCVSVNNCICHFSPLKGDTPVLLKDGDLVKVDLGAHIDGFCAVLAHTFVIGVTKEKKLTGKKANVILAAYNAAEVALRLVKPGNENNQVTEAIATVASDFKCHPIEGMLSHQLKQHVIDGEKTIIQSPSDAQKKEQTTCEFEVYEVYGVDVLLSTGEGKGREMDTKTTVYKKKDLTYNLKMKASRQFISEVEKKFSTMPFSLRMFEDEKKAKMGVVECAKHDLVESFNVLYERENEQVAQFKFTVLLMPNGPMKITGLNVDPNELYESEHSLQSPDLKKLMSESTSRKAQKKKKKKAEKQAMEVTEGSGENTEATAAES